MRQLFPVSLVPVLLVLTGCAVTADQSVSPSASANAAMQGSVHGGQQPLSGSTVSIYAVGTSGYGAGASLLASTTTDANGNFNFAPGSYTCPFANTPVYLTAQGGNPGLGAGANANIMLAAGLGACSSAASATVQLNEVTTVATAFALSHFFTTTLGASSSDAFGGTAAGNGTYNTGLVMANTYTIPTIVSIAGGSALPSSAAITRETAKLNTLANIIAACVNSTGGNPGDNTPCGTLFTAAAGPGNSNYPFDTLQAAVQIALAPYKNVATLYNLPTAVAPFSGLSTQPNDFTLGVAYNSAAFGFGLTTGTPSGSGSSIDIDASGRVWFPTNSATSSGIGYFDPTSNTFNGPFATSLIHPQYVAIDNTGMAYASDLGSALVAGVSTTSPTGAVDLHTLPPGSTVGPISATSNSGVSNALMYAVNTGNTFASATNLWILQNGNQGESNTFTFPPTGLAAFNYQNAPTYFEAEAATSNGSNSCLLEAPYTYQGQSYQQTLVTSSSPCTSGGVVQLDGAANESLIVAQSLNQVCSYNAGACFPPPVSVNSPFGVAVDGDSNVWLANAGNASVSTFLFTPGMHTSAAYTTTSTVAYIHDFNNGNTMTNPLAIAIDRSGNVWVQNAGCTSQTVTACTPTAFVLSELIGAAAPTVTPLVTSDTNNTHVTRPSNVLQKFHADDSSLHHHNVVK